MERRDGMKVPSFGTKVAVAMDVSIAVQGLCGHAHSSLLLG